MFLLAAELGLVAIFVPRFLAFQLHSEHTHFQMGRIGSGQAGLR